MTHLKIDIQNNYDTAWPLAVYVHTLKEPVHFPYLYTLKINLINLGYAVNDMGDYFMLSAKTSDSLRFEDGKLILSKFWQRDYCNPMTSDPIGFNKLLFVDIQVLVYELLEMAENGILQYEITYNEMPLNPRLPELRMRNGNTTKKMIHMMKRRVPLKTNTKTLKCEYRKNKPIDGDILACCLCRPDDIILAEL